MVKYREYPGGSNSSQIKEYESFLEFNLKTLRETVIANYSVVNKVKSSTHSSSIKSR